MKKLVNIANPDCVLLVDDVHVIKSFIIECDAGNDEFYLRTNCWTIEDIEK